MNKLSHLLKRLSPLTLLFRVILLFSTLLFIIFSITITLNANNSYISQNASPHNDAATERSRCLTCHGSLPPDMKDPVYKECRLWTHCSVCHGTGHGKGDGIASQFLFPKPRDFNRGIFKFKSTPESSSPTEKDLFNIVTRGISGSAMPSFAFLSEEERWALVDHVKTLGGVQEVESPSHIDKPPLFTKELIIQGKLLYKKRRCWECHGITGKGDGPKSNSLRDDWGFPINPTNFNKGIFKGGDSLQDIYLRITEGINGTPMPSYKEFTTTFDRWALTTYIISLSKEKKLDSVLSPLYSDTSHSDTPFPSTTIKAIKVNAANFHSPTSKSPTSKSPTSESWLNVPSYTISLSPLWQKHAEKRKINVYAMHNGKELAILLEWEGKKTVFPSACAVQFPTTSFIPTIVMGQKGYPVRIWYWKELDKIEEIIAEGIGTITTIPDSKKNIDGNGKWNKIPSNQETNSLNQGKWKVVFVRKLITNNDTDVQFVPGETTLIAFAIWKGEKQERDGQKSISTWYKLIIEK